MPLDWSATDGPQREVLKVLAGSVGYGETIRYGQLASLAGLTATDDTIPARAVGKIMGSNPIPVIVPCHRVLASDGLGGYSGGAGVKVKRWLLILEGALPPTLDWQPMDLPDSLPTGLAGAVGQTAAGRKASLARGSGARKLTARIRNEPVAARRPARACRRLRTGRRR